MRRVVSRCTVVLGTALLMLIEVGVAQPKPFFVAFSLRQAASEVKTGTSVLHDPRSLAGITRVAGMVEDTEGGDLILVGLASPDLPEITLDDLVVALRARILHERWPLVSIDPLPETQKTKTQAVRFDGHIEDSLFGRSFLECDVLLKKYSLQLIKGIPSVHSYTKLLEDDIRMAAEKAGVKVTSVKWCSSAEGVKLCDARRGVPISSSESHQARFWFYVLEPYVYADKNNVFGIKELRLALQSECAFITGTNTLQTAQVRFPQEWTEHFEEMYQAFPDLRRLKALYDLTAVAEAVRKVSKPPFVAYFLTAYSLPDIKTAKEYKLEEIYGVVARSDGMYHLVRVSGGIEFKTEVRWLNDGDFTPLRDIVLKTRPSTNALSWRLPLDDWLMQNARDILRPFAERGSGLRGEGTGSGCSVSCDSFLLDPKAPLGTQGAFAGFASAPAALPPLKGVSMRMQVDNSSFRQDESGQLKNLREQLLQGRKSKDTLTWPTKNAK